MVRKFAARRIGGGEGKLVHTTLEDEHVELEKSYD
jgi:hypothetical protein